ncbi:vasopressin V2 receptor [Aplysia californica]|uniref:Vasopressin V2 receptor n=1 Tax=Aplysia californica TaxID=6500 RepID=A0ABM0K8W0_APLCA|nr:vasopressin V2 receptor [Aplysia californica]WGM83071.1 class A G-protein coupled receptor 3 [Aplysia californica]
MATDSLISPSSNMGNPQVTTPTKALVSWSSILSGNDSFGNGTNFTLASDYEEELEKTVHDMEYNTDIRKAILYVQIVVGITGALMLFFYMLHSRRLSRVNALILNLCVADLMVVTFSCVTQLVWEHLDRRWLAGDVMCRLIKLLQIFAICASTNMLVVIAVDRHQAITAPLRKQFSVLVMAAVGWGAALLCSLPILYVFHVRYDEKKNVTLCENIFRNRPREHRQAFLTYAGLVNFLIPLIILCVCYIRIFLKIARKASDSRTTKRQSFKPGKIHLTSSTTSATLQSAKLKTLRMTVVIVTCFIVCGLPYFIAEMILSYGDFHMLSKSVYALLGGIAVANSAVNPYIFLLFSVNHHCLRSLKMCPAQTGPNNRQLMYNGSVRSREYSTAAYSRTPVTNVSTTDALELTTTTNTKANKEARFYQLKKSLGV